MAMGRTPEERFIDEINSLKQQIAELQARTIQVPVFNADPTTDFKGNIWMFQDGRVHIRLADGTIKELVTSASSGGTSGTSAPAVPAQPTVQVGEWEAVWSQAYRQSGGFTGSNPNYLYYGSAGDSYNGKQTSLVGFDYAAISAALAGAVINSVEIGINNLHTWPSGGTTTYFGMHNNATKPSNYSGAAVVANQVSSAKVLRNQWAFHSVSTAFGSNLRDGVIKGIIIQAPNSTTSYYGYAAGVGSGLTPPHIRITYTK